MPLNIADLYRDRYFALTPDDARSNSSSRIGYEASYEDSGLDAEFYWAYRLSDHIASRAQGENRERRCLDVGAATGRLLNVFSAAGYATHGIEFSAPARDLAARRGHIMSSLPTGDEPTHVGRFSVVTALEVIEHVEDLPRFFLGIHTALAPQGVFMGYFPSADDASFASGADYHWLHNSFEHLLYPSESGIRKLLEPLFGSRVFVATFLTRQASGVIPNTVVVAVKDEISLQAHSGIAELFRQLAYLNDRACFELGSTPGAGALQAAWNMAASDNGHDSHLPYVAALLCAKFGQFEAAQTLRGTAEALPSLEAERLLDLLIAGLHDGSIDWMRTNMRSIGSRTSMRSIFDECAGVVRAFDSRHPQVALRAYESMQASASASAELLRNDAKVAEARSRQLAQDAARMGDNAVWAAAEAEEAKSTLARLAAQCGLRPTDSIASRPQSDDATDADPGFESPDRSGTTTTDGRLGHAR